MEIEKYAKELVNLLTECFNEMLINDDLKSLMHFILTRLVKVTNNKYGFIGEIKKDRFGKQYLYQQTVVHQSNNNFLPSTHYKPKKHFFGFLRKDDSENELQIDNDQDIYDYEKLFDLIYSEKQIIISNDVNKDPRRQIRKDLESQFKRFIGIPLFYQDEIISILILANYEGEYNNKYIEIIKPFVPLINNIIITYQKRISIIYQKNLFISNMSHEVRTPLNGIVGVGQILMESSLTEEQLKLVHMINKSSLQLLSFINDLLDFSHISDGKIKFEIKEFNLEECLKTAIELFQMEMEEKKICLEICYDTKLPKKIIHDRQRIQQIIVNLVSNAVKFSDNSGQIIIDLKLDKILSEDELLLQLSIIDTGCGISELDLDKMRKFLNSPDIMSFTNNFGLGYGYVNGLGLPISKFLINKMNGYLDIQSSNIKPNNGTIITVKIPVKFNESYNNNFNNFNDYKSKINNQTLIISNNVEKRINIVDNVIKNGLLPIPVNTIEECNIYINNENTSFYMIILLIDTVDDLNKTITVEDNFNEQSYEQKYIIHKLINNCKKNHPRTRLLLFYNKNNTSYDHNIFDIINEKYDINMIYNNNNNNNTNNNNNNINNDLKNILSNNYKKISLKHNSSIKLENNIIPKILSVEDNLTNQQVINKMLNEIGIPSNYITNLYDGVNFIENLEKGNVYDIIFIDLKMPRLNGIEAVKEIQSKKLKKNTFFVAITATVTDDTIKECFKIGMDAFIPKPIQISDLINIINIIINKIN